MYCSHTNKDSIDFVEHTIAYEYDDDNLYHLTFDTDSTLHWEAMSGSEKGVKGNEQYIAEWVSPTKLFITWGEETGTGVSQILDFEKGIVYNHLLFGREFYAGKGTITLLD